MMLWVAIADVLTVRRLLPVGDAALTSKLEKQVQDQERQQPEAARPPRRRPVAHFADGARACGENTPAMSLAPCFAEVPLWLGASSAPGPHTGTAWGMNLPQPDPEDTVRWWGVHLRREGLRGVGFGVQVAATPLPSEHVEALTQGAGSRRRWWINEHPTQSFGKVRSLYRLHHRPTPLSTARLKHPRGPSAAPTVLQERTWWTH